MVKRKSFLGPNEAFRVRFLVGVLFLTLEPDGQATGCNPVEVGSIPTGVSAQLPLGSTLTNVNRSQQIFVGLFVL
jgi:hypothetical protein